jgi:small GTP-binding protein
MDSTKDYDLNNLWGEVENIINDLEEEIKKPKILVAGKTGVGKSSVLNALGKGDFFEVGVTPTTKNNEEDIWKTKNGEDIVVVDVPGFGEADEPKINNESYEQNIINKVKNLEGHILLLVIKADDRALEKESNFLKEWYSDDVVKNMPVIVVVNQIDKITPVRDWNPDTLNLKTPVSKKEKNIRTYLDYVSSLNYFNNLSAENKLLPVSAGESFDDQNKYGIENLRNKIYELLPEAARTLFARATKLRNKEAKKIINKYSSLCFGSVAANFSPASDALILAPIQIKMITHLGKLYDLEINKSVITGLISSFGLSLTGRYAAQTVISFFPVVKNIVGPPLAFTLTYSMGLTVNELFSKGKTTATQKEIDKYMKNNIKKAKTQSKKV